MLADILPTGFECGVLNGTVQPDSAVPVVGSRSIGLAALSRSPFPGGGLQVHSVLVFSVSVRPAQHCSSAGLSLVTPRRKFRRDETICRWCEKSGAGSWPGAFGITPLIQVNAAVPFSDMIEVPIWKRLALWSITPRF
jgi:hypothetical protein